MEEGHRNSVGLKMGISLLLVIGILLGLLGVESSNAQQTIHYWSFNDGRPSELDSGNNEPTSIPADIGTATIDHTLSFGSSTGTTVNTEDGFAAGEDWTVSGSGNIGKHFDIVADLSNYENIILSFAIQRSGAGYDNNTLEVSSDGGTTWEPVKDNIDFPESYEKKSYDLSAVDKNVNENDNVIIRLTFDVDETSGVGNNRYDNIRIAGTPTNLIFSKPGGGPPPAGWSFGSESDDIDRGDFWLLQDENKPNEEYFIETAEYDLSEFDVAQFNVNVATFGTGTQNPLLVELSQDGGGTFSATLETETPSSSDYIVGGALVFDDLSENVVLRFSNAGESGRGVRIKDLSLKGFDQQELEVQKGEGAGWRMLSFPVDDVKVSDLAAQNQVQGITGANEFYDGMENLDNIESNLLYYLDDDEWQNPDDFDHQFGSGEGVIWYMYDNDEGVSVELPFTLSVNGTSPESDVTVSRNTSDDFTLIGNPFPVDLSTSDVSGWGDIQATAWTWDPDAGENGEYKEIDNAEAFTGFFVEKEESATEEDITIPYPQPARSTGGAERKIALQLEGTNAEGLTLTDQSSSVRFIEGARDGWDIYDATKLTPLNNAYATIGFVGKRGEEERIKSIDSRPVDVEGTIEIPLALSTFNFGGDFELSADLVNVPEGWSVILTDHQTGIESDLTSETYSFEYATEKSKARKAVKPMQPERFTMDASESESERFFLTITPDEATTADPGADLPQELTLNQNYPNPFNPVTTVSYELPEDARVELAVYDLMGRRVTTLVDEQQSAGEHEAGWDASKVASGTYMYRLTVDSRHIQTRTMTLLK